MGKLVESTFTTLDGVINDPARWGAPYWDDEHGNYAGELLFASDALLLGRKTWEGFREAWPRREGEFADKFNSMPKYVASRTMKDLDWNTTVVTGDVAAEVAKLKESHNLLKYGTGPLSKTLLEHKLVDEYHLWIFPVVAGGGDRLFDGLELTHLRLTGSTEFKSGIVVHRLAPK